VNTEKLQTALRSLTELMDDVLDSDEPGRFARIQRLAVLAQKLQNEGANTVKDFATVHMCGADDVGYDGIIGGPGVIDVARPRLGGLGDGDTIRNVMDALMPNLAAQGGAATARQRRDSAEELNELITARARFGGGTGEYRRLTRRIENLVDNITEETDHAAELPVVPTELLRGHLPGAEDGAANTGDAPGAVIDGEAGSAGPVEASPGVASALTVGVSLGLGADPRGDYDPADAAPERADLAGAASAVPSTETWP